MPAHLLIIEDNADKKKALETLINEVETAAGELQSEASLIFVMGEQVKLNNLWPFFPEPALGLKTLLKR